MKQIVQDFIELAKVDAVSRQERAICDVLKAKLLALGCEVKEDDVAAKIEGASAGNIIAVIDGGLPGSILFCAHMDRVQNGMGIKPCIIGDKICSDGSTILSADDLSGVVAILDGLRSVVESGLQFPRVEIVFTVCEEIGLRGSNYLNVGQLKSQIGYVLDSPGRIGRILVSAMGKTELYLDVKGQEAHCAYPEKGKSALRAAIRILNQIKDGRIDSETVANWSYLESLTNPNTVPGHVHAEAFLLSRSDQTMGNYTKEFFDVCRSVEENFGCKVFPKAITKYPAFRTSKDSKCVKLACSALEKLGVTPSIEEGSGGFDANLISRAGIDMVGLSTGYNDNHTVNESIYIDDLVKSGQMVKEIILAYE